MSRWHADLAAHDEAFACLQDLFTPQSFAMTAVKAIREWGQGLLRLSAALVKENDALERENARLRERIAELERSAALDSTTSSKPPASDGLKKKSGDQEKKSGDQEKRTRSRRGKSDRPSGGQPGHKGTTLERTENPDHVVDHDPSACEGCGAPLSDADRHGAPVCRQVFDVPEPQPLEATEHRGHRCLCAACGTMTTAAFPNGVSAPVQYGPRITAWVTYLLHAQFIPEKRVAEVMSDLFAVKISTATIAAMGRRTARRFEGFLDRVAEIIRTEAPVKHLDETGIRIAARTHWLHVLCTPLLTILRVASGRGHFDEKLNGIVIHDDYATYFALEGVRHGACNAHHLRELQALIEIEKEDWATSTHQLLSRANRAARFGCLFAHGLPASPARMIATCPHHWSPASREPGTASSNVPSPLTKRCRRSRPESADDKSAASVTTSRSGSRSTRRGACASSPTREPRSRTMRRSAICEWASCVRKSQAASARCKVPATSPTCGPSSPPLENSAGMSSKPWRTPIPCS